MNFTKYKKIIIVISVIVLILITLYIFGYFDQSMVTETSGSLLIHGAPEPPSSIDSVCNSC